MLKPLDYFSSSLKASHLLFALFGLFLLPNNALAGIYKCVSEDGSTYYSGQACAHQSEEQKVDIIRNKNYDLEACPQIMGFIGRVASAMKRKESSLSVMDEYGGVDALAKSAVLMVNYVYTFKLSRKTSVSRIKSLAFGQCKNGAFGNIYPQDIPQLTPSQQQGLNPWYNNEWHEQDGRYSVQQPQNLGWQPNRNQQKSTKSQAKCNKYQRKLDAVNSKLRAGYNIQQAENLHQKQRNYKDLIKQYCD